MSNTSIPAEVTETKFAADGTLILTPEEKVSGLFVARNCRKISIPQLIADLPARDKEAPGKTLAACEQFKSLGLTDFFHYLHHMAVTLEDHMSYVSGVKFFTNRSNNWFVMWRVETAIEFAQAGCNPKEAIELALTQYPFAQCEEISESGKKEKKVAEKKAAAPATSKKIESDWDLLASSV